MILLYLHNLNSKRPMRIDNENWFSIIHNWLKSNRALVKLLLVILLLVKFLSVILLLVKFFYFATKSFTYFSGFSMNGKMKFDLDK